TKGWNHFKSYVYNAGKAIVETVVAVAEAAIDVVDGKQDVTVDDKNFWERKLETFTEAIKEAEQGKVQPVKTVAVMQAGASSVVPTLKRVHYVNDPELIKQCLLTKRGGDVLDSGFYDDMKPLIDKHSMLLSPETEHRRLRSPLEKTFAK